MAEKEEQSCPVCGALFDSEILSRHVNSHFDKVQEVRCSYPGCVAVMAESEMCDHLLLHEIPDDSGNLNDSLLARLTQEEEHVRCDEGISESDLSIARSMQKEEEKEVEEFKKLQETYGMSSKGSYMSQFNDNASKKVGKNLTVSDYYKQKGEMMEILMSGYDPMTTSTQGVITALHRCYDRKIKDINAAYLSCECHHFGVSIADKGWGCGYRNMQMLMSSLITHSTFAGVFPERIFSIPKIQELIEEAWKQGFDPAGCDQLNGALQNTRKWIGTTEIAVVLRSFKLRAQIVDFHKPTGDHNTHPAMFQWIRNYFLKKQFQPPLYVQHQGHSQLCVGCEDRVKCEFPIALLLFDPSVNVKTMSTTLKQLHAGSFNHIRLLRKTLKQLNQSQFQVLYVEGVMKLGPEFEQSKIITSTLVP